MAVGVVWGTAKMTLTERIRNHFTQEKAGLRKTQLDRMHTTATAATAHFAQSFVTFSVCLLMHLMMPMVIVCHRRHDLIRLGRRVATVQS